LSDLVQHHRFDRFLGNRVFANRREHYLITAKQNGLNLCVGEEVGENAADRGSSVVEAD
jgi:hypothetical protein